MCDGIMEVQEKGRDRRIGESTVSPNYGQLAAMCPYPTADPPNIGTSVRIPVPHLPILKCTKALCDVNNLLKSCCKLVGDPS